MDFFDWVLSLFFLSNTFFFLTLFARFALWSFLHTTASGNRWGSYSTRASNYGEAAAYNGRSTRAIYKQPGRKPPNGEHLGRTFTGDPQGVREQGTPYSFYN